jgi:hypothetical protein
MLTFAEQPTTTQQPARAKSALPARMQMKLGINKPGGEHEQEADRTAGQVMRMPEPQLQGDCPCGGGCPRCSPGQPGSERKSVQRKPLSAGDIGQISAPAIVHEVLRSTGQPLDPATRAFMEPRFGYDFSRVRIHTGAAAEQSAQEVSAQAFTVGHDIVLGADRYAPATAEGRRLLAHELTHVVQSASTALHPGPPGSVETLEGEAHRVAEAVSNSNNVPPIRGSAHGLSVPLRQPPDPVKDKATFSNLPRDAPDEAGMRKRVVLSEEGGLWYETRLNGRKFRAEGAYDFVVQKGKIWAVKGSRAIGAPDAGHTEAAGGGPGEYMGMVRFGRGTTTRGVVQEWSNASGHHAPVGYEKFAEAAGFPMDKFKRVTGGFPDMGPQLPVYQPATRSRDGGPAKVPAGPSRLGELEQRIGAPEAGAKSGMPSRTPPATAGKTEATTGAPVEPVVEATPGYNPGVGNAVGGAVQILQAKMVGNLQGAEVAKYEKRLAELQPSIDKFLSSGYSVHLILIVEKPKTVDLFCKAGAFCDSGQLNYFHALFIDYVESVTPVVGPFAHDTTHATISTPGGRDGYIPFTHEGGSLIDVNMIPSLSTRDSEHRCEYARMTLNPPEAVSPLEMRRPPAPPVKPKPQLTSAEKIARAVAPSEVYMLYGNIKQYETVREIQKKLTGNASFGLVKETMGGGYRSHTIISYWSILDKPRAEALVEIIRSAGVSPVEVNFSGSGGDGIPGSLQVLFGRGAER